MITFEENQMVEIINGECSGEKGIVKGKSKMGSRYYDILLLERNIVAPFYYHDLLETEEAVKVNDSIIKTNYINKDQYNEIKNKLKSDAESIANELFELNNETKQYLIELLENQMKSE